MIIKWKNFSFFDFQHNSHLALNQHKHNTENTIQMISISVSVHPRSSALCCVHRGNGPRMAESY